MNSERLALLKKLKHADLKADVPSVSFATAEFLHQLITKRNVQNALEIGTAHAFSSIFIGDALETTGGHLITIEHSPPSFKQAKLNLYRAKLEHRVTQMAGRAQTIVAEALPRQRLYDFIFIDGMKKSTTEFFEVASPKLADGGIIVVDDVIKFKSKMQNFYDFLDQQSVWQYDIHQLDEDDGIMLISRA